MSGTPSNDEHRRQRVVPPTMVEQPSVPMWFHNGTGAPVWQLPDTMIGPDPDGGADFDDDEWAEFLAAVGVVPRGEEECD